MPTSHDGNNHTHHCIIQYWQHQKAKRLIHIEICQPLDALPVGLRQLTTHSPAPLRAFQPLYHRAKSRPEMMKASTAAT